MTESSKLTPEKRSSGFRFSLAASSSCRQAPGHLGGKTGRTSTRRWSATQRSIRFTLGTTTTSRGTHPTYFEFCALSLKRESKVYKAKVRPCERRRPRRDAADKRRVERAMKVLLDT